MVRGALSAAVLAVALGLVRADAYSGSDRVRLDDVKALTFRSGRRTAGRRSAPVPELNCVGGDCSFEPDVVQCRNVGSDGFGDVQWRCECQLPSDLQLGTTDVTCEGFKSRDDPYVLSGSCGLEYTLRRTGNGGSFDRYYTGPGNQRGHRQGKSWLGSLVSWAFFFLGITFLYNLFTFPARESERRGRSRDPDGVAGDQGDDDYYYEQRRYSSRGRGGDGFWSGLGLGWLGASMFGGGGRRYGYGGYGYGNGCGGNDWGNGWGGGGWGGGGWNQRTRGWGGGGWGGGGGYGGRSNHGGGGGGGGGGGHTSRGYGGTRRR